MTHPALRCTPTHCITHPNTKATAADREARARERLRRAGRDGMVLVWLMVLLAGASGARGQFTPDLGGEAGPNAKQLVDVRLVPFAESIAPGETVWMGVRFDIVPGWHIYWRHPGDSGLPTRIEWNLPEGWSAGEIHWPTPERFEMAGGLVNIGYDERVMLLVPITAAADAEPGQTANLTATVRYLVCDDQRCLSADPVTLSGTLGVAAATRVIHEAELARWRAEVPTEADADDPEALKPVRVNAGGRTGTIHVNGSETRALSIFMAPDDDFAVRIDPIRESGALRGWSYRVRPFGEVDFTDRTLWVVVVWEEGISRQKSVGFELPLDGRR